jgi:hypothetical protein
MRKRALCLLGGWAALCALAFAQQGHPLTGTWSGDYGLSPTQRTQITFVLNWDGKSVTGQINPGPDSIPLASVYVDPTTWTVRMEADMKDTSGKMVHVAAEGHLDDIGSYHRTITGSWRQGTAKGDFKITRD